MNCKDIPAAAGCSGGQIQHESSAEQWQQSISSTTASKDEAASEPKPLSRTMPLATQLHTKEPERRVPPALFDPTSYDATRSGSPRLVLTETVKEPCSQRNGDVGTAENTRSYSLTQSRVMTQVVAMLYFAGFICTNSLMPQFMVHRLSKYGQGSLNSSQREASSPCHKGNSSSSAHADAIQSQVRNDESMCVCV